MNDLRSFINRAVECGRSLQSQQTALIHHSYTEPACSRETVPIIENALFALALMRTRLGDNIREAQSILERLLAFECDGNFPIYLHEYPKCNHPWLPVKLAPVIFWALKEFSHVLSKELRARLESSLASMIEYCLQKQEKQTPAYSCALLTAALAQAVGKLLDRSDFRQFSEKRLPDLLESPDLKALCSPRRVTDLIIAMQMMEQPFEKLLHHLQTTWHPNCLSYIGPPLHELYSEEEPELTFYDLFMGYCSGKISSRMKKQNPVLLQSALLRQSRMDSFELSESENQNGTVICKEENFAYSAIPTGSHQLADQGLHALRCIWKSNNDLLKSFVCPRGPYDVAVESQDGGVDLIFTLSESIDLSNSKQCREIPFYLTLSNSSKLRIEGESATTFNLVDLVSIDDEPLSISLSFELLEGEGTFLGHILYGNRPSQLKAKGDNRFSAYDKLILLRTVRRSGICRMKAKVRIKARSIL